MVNLLARASENKMKTAKFLATLPEYGDIFTGRAEPYWITSKLGTMSELDYCPRGIVVLDMRDLYDGPGNDPAEVWRRIKRGAELIRSGKRVVIKCSAGISRSNSVATGILAVLQWNEKAMAWGNQTPIYRSMATRLHYMDCLSTVQKKVPRAYPNPDINNTIVEALELGMWKP